MACRPPIKPKSIPYWKGQRDTSVHAARHFQWSLMLYLSSVPASGAGELAPDTVERPFFSSAMVFRVRYGLAWKMTG